MPATYTKPPLPPGSEPPVNLASVDLKAIELTPKTAVLCINRGSAVYFDKYDGRDYEVPPGVFEVAYEVAAHFRERSVVPGSRNPITGGQQTYIAILGIDRPEDCEPFNAAETAAQASAPEALDRSDMSPEERAVKVVPTQAVRARTAGRGRTREVSVEQNASHDPAPGALEPPGPGDEDE